MNENDFMAISELLDKKLKPLGAEIKQVKTGLEAEIQQMRADLGAEIQQTRADLGAEIQQTRFDLGAEIQQTRADLGAEIHGLECKVDNLESELHLTKLLLENDIVPRLENIENCYTGTYDRYVVGLEEMQALQADVDILKRVAKEHDKKLQTM